MRTFPLIGSLGTASLAAGMSAQAVGRGNSILLRLAAKRYRLRVGNWCRVPGKKKVRFRGKCLNC